MIDQERIAIRMFDGKMTEAEAIEAERVNPYADLEERAKARKLEAKMRKHAPRDDRKKAAAGE